MPTYVDPNKCGCCRELDRPACMYIRPMDLMKLDGAKCFSCVNFRPNSAIERRGYADVMPKGATLKPLGGAHSIIWTANYRDGPTERFKLPIRDTAWGTIANFPDDARPRTMHLKWSELFGEHKYLGVDRLPLPGNS